MWLLGEDVENDPSVLSSQAEEIAARGFHGVMVFPRGGSLDHIEPRMVEIFCLAAKAAGDNGLKVWMGADPRLASDALIEASGEALEVSIINREPYGHWNGRNLNASLVENGSFEWVMEYPKLRLTHMHQSGGVRYIPIGIEKVYAIKRVGETGVQDFRDVTDKCELLSEPENCIVRIKGDLSDEFEGWEILAFPRFRTNFYDYTGTESWKVWTAFVEKLYSRLENIAGVCWDEVGFYCESGKYPLGDRIEKIFLEEHGYSIRDNLIWLVLDSDDNRHIRVRNDYFVTLNNIITDSMKRSREFSVSMATKYGRVEQEHGIHATWHGEFCGIEEMNHGSLDVWKIRPHQTGAYTDIGGNERHADPVTGPDMVYSMVLARSLSRVEPKRRIIYSNLWGIDYGTPGDGTPPEIMEYWRWFLDLFGARWLAHAYGWPGTRYSDLRFGPGYPDHPTWGMFDRLNKDRNPEIPELEKYDQLGDVLALFPLESFYALGHYGENRISGEFIKLIDRMFRAGYMIDIVSGEWLENATVSDGSIELNSVRFRSLVLPYCRIVRHDTWQKIREIRDAGIPVIADCAKQTLDTGGQELEEIVFESTFDLMNDPLAAIGKVIHPTCDLPDGSMGNIWLTENGAYVYLMPHTFDRAYDGNFRFGNFEIKIEERRTPLVLSIGQSEI